MINCAVCDKVFTVKRNLTCHIKTHEGDQFSYRVYPKLYKRRE